MSGLVTFFFPGHLEGREALPWPSIGMGFMMDFITFGIMIGVWVMLAQQWMEYGDCTLLSSILKGNITVI